jgi:cytochrome d ubiquinol oxidase subunit II
MALAIIWFVLVFVLLAGYAILDGFDLGVGTLHLLVPRDDRERRVSLNAIGPVWDGNEVWLLTGGGALFAAFPLVYATVFSGFYTALMLLLLALIARAVAMEFRSKVESAGWRKAWDVVFSIGSLLPGVLLGVAFGNVIRGIPIDASGDFVGTFIGLLNPFSVAVGVLTLVSFVLHGSIYLAMKSEGELQRRAARWIRPAWLGQIALFSLVTVWATYATPQSFAGVLTNPIFWVLVSLLLGSIGFVPYWACEGSGGYGKAFAASGTSIASMIGLAAVGLFPRLVPSSLGPDFSLTIANSHSTERTLTVMLVVALIGMPLVITYTALIYRAFRGPVVLGEESY